ncbi:hypothetical protein GQX74_012527 [Glossina fuscipes]|nr:hypothetical protein GQX74_012527 [Glossina fuscipes]
MSWPGKIARGSVSYVNGREPKTAIRAILIRIAISTFMISLTLTHIADRRLMCHNNNGAEFFDKIADVLQALISIGAAKEQHIYPNMREQIYNFTCSFQLHADDVDLRGRIRNEHHRRSREKIPVLPMLAAKLANLPCYSSQSKDD